MKWDMAPEKFSVAKRATERNQHRHTSSNTILAPPYYGDEAQIERARRAGAGVATITEAQSERRIPD
jgi:hypothetical protein